MIPRTFPSTFAANGQQQMVVYSLPSITGLTAWIDYIPVKGVTTESATLENTYANGGYQVVNSLASLTGKQAWLDYIPVYEDASYTKPWSTDAGGYIPTSALAALLLDFTSGRLDPRITFSRTTNATLTNSAGLVANAPMNLLTFSEQFDNAAWVKNTGGTGSAPVVTANAAAAPDGTTTADRVVFNKGAGTTTADLSIIQQATSSITGVGSVYVRADTPVTIMMRAGSTFVALNVTTSWQRFTTAFESAASLQIGLRPGYGITIPDSATVFLWGAQLEISSTATTYNPTTVKNLLGFTEHFDNAAWTKSNSFVQTNLLTYSQDFDNAAWIKDGVTIAANNITAPNGTATADKYVESALNELHSINSNTVTTSAGVTYTLSVYAKNAGRFLRLILPTATFGTPASANFDLVSGVAYNTAGSGAEIQDVGDGWYRCSVRVTATISASGITTVASAAASSGTGIYQGNGTDGVFLWGAQLVQGTSAGDYKATYAAAAAVGYIDIYGQPFAQKLVENTANAAHRVQVTVVLSGAPVASSAYFKAGERSFGYLRFDDASSTRFAYFNLASGTLGTVDAALSAAIQDVGNGWYRCSAVFAAPVATGSGVCVIGAASTNNVAIYTGDGTSGIYIFGAQLSDSASVDPYVYQPVAAPSSVAYYGPRFDYDPVTLAPKGLLIEEQRTNLLLRSEEFDNAGWTKSNATITANSVAAPSGTVTADTVVSTATTGASSGASQGVTGTAASHTFSVYAKAGTINFLRLALTSNTVAANAWFNLATGAVGTVESGITALMTNAGNGWYRCSVTRTLAAVSETCFMRLADLDNSLSAPSGSSVYVYGAQLEAGAFATSYIPTAASQVTRAADSASMIGNNFARWFNVSAGTFYCAFDTNAATAAGYAYFVSDGTGNNYHRATINTTALSLQSGSGGSNVVNFAAIQSGMVAGTSYPNAYAYQSGSFAGVVRGGAVTTSANTVLPIGLNQMAIGNGFAGTALQSNGHIQRIAYYNRRLSNTELQGITS